MATHKTYLEDATLLRDEATVVAVGVRDDGRPWVRLDRTIFHAQGGGQKADRGAIGDAQVYDVRHGSDGVVEHVLEDLAGLAVGQEVVCVVDAARRRLGARLHTAGHLIAAVVEARHQDLRAVTGHHWPGEARVDFVGEIPAALEPLRMALEDDLGDALASDAAVVVLGDPQTDRSVGIGAFAPVPCGGTHCQRLGEVGSVAIRRVRKKSGKLRISYECP